MSEKHPDGVVDSLPATQVTCMSFLRHGQIPGFPHIFTTFLSCSRRHLRPVNCAHALPLYYVLCYALPNPCASISAMVTSPRRLQTLFIQFTHTSRLPTVMCVASFDGFDVLIANSVRISLFSYTFTRTFIYVSLHAHDCISDSIVSVFNQLSMFINSPTFGTFFIQVDAPFESIRYCGFEW